MYSKVVLVAAYLAIIAIVLPFAPTSSHSHHSTETNKSHNLIIGGRQSNDKLVFQQNISESSSFMKVITIEQTFSIGENLNITQIQVLDQKNDGTGAQVSLSAGGPGLNNATLQFKSQRNHGIHCSVLIYAK